MKALFTVMKIFCLPVILIFKLAGILLYSISMLSTKITGPLLTFLGACCIYCIVIRSWRDVLILGGCISIICIFYILDGFLIVGIKVIEKTLLSKNGTKRMESDE